MHHFDIAYKLTHLILLSVEVLYIGFSLQDFKIQLSQTLQTYVIFKFFISLHVQGQPEHFMRRFTSEHHVHEYK